MGEFVSVVLLPDEDDAVILCELSSRLQNSEIKLGEGSLPHITVAQFEAPSAICEELWNQVKHLNGRANAALSDGIGFVPVPSLNATWVEIEFLKSGQLQMLQSAVLETDFAASHNVNNGTEDKYHPHITLGLLEGFASQMLDLSDFTGLFRREFRLHLAVGPNGHNFTFSSVQFSS